MAKSARATTAQLYTGWYTFELDQKHVTKNQPATMLVLLSESLSIMWQFQLTSSLKGTPQRIGKGNKEDHILVCCLSHARVSTRGSRFNSSLKRNNLQRMQSQLIILSFSFWKRPVDNTCEETVSSFTSLKKYPVVTSQTITWCKNKVVLPNTDGFEWLESLSMWEHVLVRNCV